MIQYLDEHTKRQIIAALFFSVLIVVPVMWMLMDRTPPFTVEHVEIVPNNVDQGNDIHVVLTVKQNHLPCNFGIIHREFKEFSGKVHFYDPVVRTELPAVENNKIISVVKLPDSISPGPTIYRSSACYFCNPIQGLLHWPICVLVPGVEFNVMKELNDSR